MFRKTTCTPLVVIATLALLAGCADGADGVPTPSGLSSFDDNKSDGGSTDGSASQQGTSSSGGGASSGSSSGASSSGGGTSSSSGTSAADAGAAPNTGGSSSGGEASGSSGGSGDNGGASSSSSSSGADAGTFPGDPDKGTGTGSDAGSSSSADAGTGTTTGPDAGSTDATPAPTCNKIDPTKLYLSADDSNSMAGATVARGLIKQGQHVYKGLRTYEFLNYYGFEYPAAKSDHVAASAQLAKHPDGDYHLQVAIRSPQITADERRNAHLIVAVDTSSSMGWGPKGDTGMDRTKAACTAIASSLRKGDLISLVTWGGATQTILPAFKVTGADDSTLVGACGALAASGTTNLGGGLTAAYDLAQKHFDKALINRVVLISDGGTNVGDKDKDVIAKHAKDANGEAIYLVGVGVGDPWNYNDKLMDAVTDAGKGAYVFFDSIGEATAAFGAGFLRHMEVAARDVQVAVTLPPTFGVQEFFGEQISTNPDEVEPQHLAANDAMIFNQIIKSCDPSALTGKEVIKVEANWEHPITRKKHTDTYEITFAELLAADTKQLDKGDAIVAYAEALKDLRTLKGKAGLDRIDAALKIIDAALAKLGNDPDLSELKGLLTLHKEVFSKGQKDLYPTGGTGAKPLTGTCGTCTGVGTDLKAMSCALDLCDDKILLESTYTSPTNSTTQGTFAAVKQFGDATNGLKPRSGGSYALMATGPATGTNHSEDMGGQPTTDPFAGGNMYNAMRWQLKLKAPAGANGFRIQHVFLSEEYDEYVGSQYNDKFYMVLQAGSTNGGKPTVINYTDCRDPDKHHDFICSPGMQFCNPRARYCYIAINTAASECCWLGGCPNGKAKTSIAGTGFSCAAGQGSDSKTTGSSTGWMTTEWPIEPGEEFTLTFHVHDAGDGIYDSEVILDALQFVGSVTPGTWSQTM